MSLSIFVSYGIKLFKVAGWIRKKLMTAQKEKDTPLP
jgi:hypothetical protein